MLAVMEPLVSYGFYDDKVNCVIKLLSKHKEIINERKNFNE